MLIFLVGFMGTGKSHWGRLWSKAHNIPFVDLDDAIETAAGKSVAVIFESHGEEYFRNLETETLHSFAGKKNIIISCGGGTPCFHNNMQWMNEHGVTVFVTSPANVILKRVIVEQAKRPLLKDLTEKELLAFIENKLAERQPFYAQSKITLTETDITEDTFQQIINAS